MRYFRKGHFRDLWLRITFDALMISWSTFYTSFRTGLLRCIQKFSQFRYLFWAESLFSSNLTRLSWSKPTIFTCTNNAQVYISFFFTTCPSTVQFDSEHTYRYALVFFVCRSKLIYVMVYEFGVSATVFHSSLNLRNKTLESNSFLRLFIIIIIKRITIYEL